MVNGALARGRIILVATDLMRESRIAEGARALGYEVQTAGTIDALSKALASTRPDLLVLDLQAEGVPWQDVVELARRAGGGGLAVLAYGQHTKPDILRAARVAGCDLAVPRSKLVDELPQLIERAIHAASRRLAS
jgi:DNA-binding NarL/FixJ family response regulator